MCGIAGYYNFPNASGRKRCDIDDLKHMAQAIRHRGPDGEGYWKDDFVGLGHRRLSIIDLSGGTQPMANEDGSVHVVFNGEIYNYRELRDSLRRQGHIFRTDSDTEVLVHLYEDHGTGLFDQLRGMFAFAIWDSKRRTLLIARDRVGLKPLYYLKDDERFLFASELKGILAAREVPRDIDAGALERYITFGYVPSSRSIFSSIKKLPPAHYLSISMSRVNETALPRRYWRLRSTVDNSLSESDWQEHIKEKLQETVESHKIADVGVGAFLSGGIDSAAVVSSLAKSGANRLETFSIGFEEREFTELPEARQIAQQFQTIHHEEIVRPEAANSLHDLVSYFDEPFADPSAVPTMAVARLARERVKVVMSGDGGDEAFGGYNRYVHDLQESAIRARIPLALRKSLIRRLAHIWPKADWLPRPARLKSTLTNLSLEPAQAYANTLSITRNPLRNSLLGTKPVSANFMLTPEEEIASYYPTSGESELEAMTHTDISTILPDGFLTKVDRASMAVGLEVRPPLVDHEFLEMSARIPGRFKIRNGQSKWIFKQILKDTLPETILNRKKRGFEIPVDKWLRYDLRDLFQGTVLEASNPIGRMIDQSVASRLYKSHLKGVGRHGHTLWTVLVLAKWLERYQ